MAKEIFSIDKEGLKEHSIFSGMTHEEIEKLKAYMTLEEFKPGDVIIKEGTETSEMYFILEGEVEVFKWDEAHCSTVMIGRLNQGDSFGEIAFLELSKRATTIKAILPTSTYKIASATISMPEMSDIKNKLYHNIAIINNYRLRNLNSLYVTRLKDTQVTSKQELNTGRFLVLSYLLFFFCIAIALLFPSPLSRYMGPLIVIAPLWKLVMRKFQFSFADLGCDRINGLSNLLTGIGIAAIVLLCSILIDHIPMESIGLARFHVGPSFALPSMPFSYHLLNIPFLAFYAFAYEFIARGVLQTSLKNLIRNEKGMQSIFINGVALFLAALPFGASHAVAVYLISIPLGYIYFLQKNIYGVFAIHFLLLVFGLLYI